MGYSRSMAGLVCGVLAAGTASAANWSGKGTLGGVLSRGNTDMETINANLDVATEIADWTYKMGASLLRTVEDDVASADRFELRGEANYALTERSYLFGTLRYEDDRFTDFSYQAVLGAATGTSSSRPRRPSSRGRSASATGSPRFSSPTRPRKTRSCAARSTSSTSSPQRRCFTNASWWKPARTTRTSRMRSASR